MKVGIDSSTFNYFYYSGTGYVDTVFEFLVIFIYLWGGLDFYVSYICGYG